MKKTIIFIALFFVATISYAQVYDANNHGITINTVNEAGEATVTLPNGAVFVIKAIINPNNKNKGRMTGRGFIMDIPFVPQSMEWNASTGKKEPVGSRPNEAGGFTVETATAYYIEGYTGSDNKKHYSVEQTIGSWAKSPNQAAWVSWYADQVNANKMQAIEKYYRPVNITKSLIKENEQIYYIGL